MNFLVFLPPKTDRKYSLTPRLNWSAAKRETLIGPLIRGPNFVKRTAKTDRSRIRFGELLNSFLMSRNLFTFKFGGQV